MWIYNLVVVWPRNCLTSVLTTVKLSVTKIFSSVLWISLSLPVSRELLSQSCHCVVRVDFKDRDLQVYHRAYWVANRQWNLVGSKHPVVCRSLVQEWARSLARVWAARQLIAGVIESDHVMSDESFALWFLYLRALPLAFPLVSPRRPVVHHRLSLVVVGNWHHNQRN